MSEPLQHRIDRLAGSARPDAAASREVVRELRAALNRGDARAASRGAEGKWVVHEWVKRGILLGFRVGAIVEIPAGTGAAAAMRFLDKDTMPPRAFGADEGVRLVPGGSSVRDGAYVGQGVVIMPPAFVNIGAFVGDGTMIDSHALIGSCAQVGKRCHISAGAQLGGVLEPVGAMPVIIEDDVLIGGNCGVYEGAIVRERVILASGVILTGATPVYDVVRGQVYRRSDSSPLEIPAGAVVVPGSRPISTGKGREWGLSLATPVIVKYRDEKTDLSAKLEDLLR